MADSKSNSVTRRAKRTTDVVKQRLGGAAKSASTATSRAVDRVGDGLEDRPFSALGGALALGALAAALLPATRREGEVVGPLGNRLRGALDDALKAARDAGAGELTASGLTFAAATNGLGGVVGALAKAALAASGAAATRARNPRHMASNDTADRTDSANAHSDQTGTRKAV